MEFGWVSNKRNNVYQDQQLMEQRTFFHMIFKTLKSPKLRLMPSFAFSLIYRLDKIDGSVLKFLTDF